MRRKRKEEVMVDDGLTAEEDYEPGATEETTFSESDCPHGAPSRGACDRCSGEDELADGD